jgi:hypothetical protein
MRHENLSKKKRTKKKEETPWIVRLNNKTIMEALYFSLSFIHSISPRKKLSLIN